MAVSQPAKSIAAGFFTTTRAGEMTSRVSEDVAEIRWAIADTLPEILSNIILVVGTLTVLFWMSWPLARWPLAQRCQGSCCPRGG